MWHDKNGSWNNRIPAATAYKESVVYEKLLLTSFYLIMTLFTFAFWGSVSYVGWHFLQKIW